MGDHYHNVLLLAYGTPASEGDIPTYLTHIRGGRAPSPEMVADLCRRYRAIGGSSPLTVITRAQARDLALRLGHSTCVYVGMRHAAPFIVDTVQSMVAAGVTEATAICMAPHYSSMSVGAYEKAVNDALAATENRINLRFVKSWHLHAGFITAQANRLQAAIEQLPAVGAPNVIFTAHSLPVRTVQAGDPYITQLRASCAAIAERVGLTQYQLAFQSAARSPEPWLTPTASEALQVVKDAGSSQCVVCPVGFVSDHLEVLYDIDIELAEQAKELGLTMIRTELLNNSSDFIAVLADIVQQSGRSD